MRRFVSSPAKKPSRQRILDLYAQGLSTHQVATQLRISDTWARRVKQEYRETGKTANKRTRDRTNSWQTLADAIRLASAEQSDLTPEELKVKLGIERSISTLCRADNRLGLTLKKDKLRQ
jgi:transposase